MLQTHHLSVLIRGYVLYAHSSFLVIRGRCQLHVWLSISGIENTDTKTDAEVVCSVINNWIPGEILSHCTGCVHYTICGNSPLLNREAPDICSISNVIVAVVVYLLRQLGFVKAYAT